MKSNTAVIALISDALDAIQAVPPNNPDNYEVLAAIQDFNFSAAERNCDANAAVDAFQLYLTVFGSPVKYGRCPDCGAVKENCEMFRVERENADFCLDCYKQYESEEMEQDYCVRHGITVQ